MNEVDKVIMERRIHAAKAGVVKHLVIELDLEFAGLHDIAKKLEQTNPKAAAQIERRLLRIKKITNRYEDF